MKKFREFIGYASGADVLGVPTPDAQHVGMVPVVKDSGDGYVLSYGKASEVVWENPNPSGSFSAQKITADTTKYKMFVVSFLPVKSESRIDYCIAYPGMTSKITSFIVMTDGVAQITRQIEISDDGFNIGTSTYLKYDGSDSGQTISGSTDYIVVQKIYGIR